MKDQPLACEGRWNGKNNVQKMLSELAWSADNIKESESIGFGVVYVEDPTECSEAMRCMVVYAADDMQLKDLLKRFRTAAYTDMLGTDHVSGNILSVFKEGML